MRVGIVKICSPSLTFTRPVLFSNVLGPPSSSPSRWLPASTTTTTTATAACSLGWAAIHAARSTPRALRGGSKVVLASEIGPIPAVVRISSPSLN